MDWQNHSHFRLVIPFTLGMIGANLFMDKMNLSVLFVLSCIALASLFFHINTSRNYKDGTAGITAMILFLFIGMALYTAKYQHTEHGANLNVRFCQGILVEPPKEKTHSWALELEQQNGTHLLLYIGKNKTGTNTMDAHHEDSLTFAALQIGDTISAHIRHINATNRCKDTTFRDYNLYLFHHGICATAYARPRHWEVRPCTTTPTSLVLKAKAFQETLHQIYYDHGISGEAGSVVEAMTIGRRTALSPQSRKAYANAGLSHMLALSGFHVGIIVLLMQVFFFKPILSLRWQWVSHFLLIVALWCYALMTGLSPSLVRATLMYTVLLLCQILHRDALSPNSCGLAFFIMLCLNPFYLHDIGFQLSFIAVTSIGILGKRLTNLFGKPHSLTHFVWLITIIAISLICSIFTAPLVAHYFGRIPLLAVIGNLLLFGFVYLLIWGSILWWAFLWCAPINNMLTDLLNWAATTMSNVAETLSSLPFATLEWHPNVLTTLLCYAALLTCTYIITRKMTSS